MFYFKRISIQYKLMMFFIVLATALLLVVSALFFRNIETAIRSSKEDQLATLAQETANKIERFLFERYGDILVMAQSPLLKNEGVDDRLKFEYFESVRNAYKTYDYIFTTDTTGNIRILSGDMKGDAAYLSWLSLVLRGETYISDFIFDEKDQAYKVYFAAPIINVDGKITGSVVERMNFNAIEDIVGNVRPSRSGYAYLLEADGSAIFHPMKTVTEVHTLNGRDRGLSYTLQNDMKMISAYYGLKKDETQSKSWYLIVEEPVAEAFEAAYTLRNYTLLVVLVSIAIAYALAIVMSRILTKPIRQLVEETKNIAEGDISQNIAVESTDEIGSLARSFNMLLSNLKSMMRQVLELSGEAASLAEIRQYADKFLDNVPSAVVALDSTGKITTFNSTAAELMGMQQEETLGKTVKDDLPVNVRPVLEQLQDCLESGSVYLKKIIHIRNHAGKETPIMLNTSLHKDESGKILGVVGVFRSVEEFVRLEESVVRANNLASLGALSAGMAHEIRNPLTSIKGYAQYIRSEIGEKSELHSDITIIINEVDRLNGIIDRFLSFARPSQPEVELSDVNLVVERVLKLIEKDLQPASVKLVTALEPLPPVLLDAEQMEQAILNIVINSLQAMQEGGTLKIHTGRTERSDFIEIVVSDNGTGINPEDCDRIFEPFFTTKHKGTGLGLAISSRIIENHKGFIEVDSTPGAGTRFVIKLPLDKDPACAGGTDMKSRMVV